MSKQKIISILLMISLLMTMLPTGGFAQGENDEGMIVDITDMVEAEPDSDITREITQTDDEPTIIELDESDSVVVAEPEVKNTTSFTVSDKPKESAAALPAPMALSAVTSGAASVYVSFQSVAGADHYTVMYAANGSFTNSITEITDTPYITITGLTKGSKYYFRVRTVNVDGVEGAWSQTVSATACAVAPSNLNVSAVSTTSAKLTWTKVPEADGYAIFRDNVKITTTKNTVLTFTDTGLIVGTTYNYQVYSASKVGTTEILSSVPVSLSYLTVPPAPSKITVASLSLSSMEISWTKVNGALSYEIYRSNNNGKTFTLLTTITNENTVNYTDSSNIAAGVVYQYYIVAAVSSTVKSERSAVAKGSTRPQTVTELKATPVDATSIKITWSGVEGAGGYIVLASNSRTTGFAEIADVTGTSYTEKGLSVSAVRYYKVYAYLGNINGDESVVVSSSPMALPPAKFTSTAISNSSVKLSWSASAGAAGYQLLMAEAENGAYRGIADRTNTEAVVGNIPTGKVLYFKLRPYIMDGSAKKYGDYSKVLKVVCQSPAPATFKAVRSGTSAKLTWSEVEGVRGYRLYVTINNSSAVKIANVTAATTSYTYKGLVPGSNYKFYIRSVDTVNNAAYLAEGKYADGADKTSPMAVPMGKVTNLKAITDADTDIILSWSKAAGASDYHVVITCEENPGYKVNENTTENSYTIPDAVRGYKYIVKVSAVSNASGKEVEGAAVSIDALIKVNPPEKVNAAQGSSGITVSWTPVSKADGYRVYRKTKNDSSWVLQKVVGSEVIKYSDTAIKYKDYYGSTVYYAVRPFYQAQGRTVLADTYTKVGIKIELSAPKVTAAVTSTTTVKLTWKAVADATGYQVLKATSSTGTYRLVDEVDSSKLSYNVKGLATGTEVFFKVRPFVETDGAVYYGKLSAVVSAVPNVVAPTVSASFVNKTLTIKWNKQAGVNGYYVYYSTAKDGTYKSVKIANPDTTSYTVTNLTAASTYYVYVNTYRTVNRKTVYGIASGKVGAKLNVKCTSKPHGKPISASTLQIYWNASDGIDGYRLSRAETNGGAKKVLGEVEAKYTSVNLTGMTMGKTYYYYLQTYVVNGGKKIYSAYTEVLSRRLNPMAPKNLTMSSITKSSAIVSWSAVGGADSYKVTYTAAGKTYVRTLMGNGITQFKITGLPSGQKVDISVQSQATYNGRIITSDAESVSKASFTTLK